MTSASRDSKPFYLKPPWQILFDVVKLYKVRPWDVNISYLLSSFIREMKGKGYIDFAASGSALLSASIVLRLQSEVIMKMEEPPEPPQPKPVEFIPPALQLPFRYEFTSTTLDHLMLALEGVIKSEMERRPLKVSPIIEPPSDFFMEQDAFFSEIESRIEEFYGELRVKMRPGGLSFTEIVKGKIRSGVIRAFLLLLFLATLGRVQLQQKEEFGEIHVTLAEESRSSERPYTV